MGQSLAYLPNLITLSRIAMALPIIWLISRGDSASLWLAFAIMIVCELTDWLDGFMARRTGSVSMAGKILDPMADSLYRIGVFVALVSNGWMPLWMLVIMIVRDVGISELRLMAQRKGLTVGARVSGKIKAIVQGLAQFAVVFCYAITAGQIDGYVFAFVHALLWLATLVTLWSLIDYTLGVFRALRTANSIEHSRKGASA